MSPSVITPLVLSQQKFKKIGYVYSPGDKFCCRIVDNFFHSYALTSAIVMAKIRLKLYTIFERGYYHLTAMEVFMTAMEARSVVYVQTILAL